jgi:hypothetical protein
MKPVVTAPPVLPAEHVPERAGVVGFFGSQQRSGDWLLPRLFRAFCLAGNVEIDLTRARVGPGTSHIEVRAVMGNIEITVPPWLRVEVKGVGLLGNFEHKSSVSQALDPAMPLIVVDGVALMGNVEVKVVDPNAPGFVDRLMARITG